MDRRKLARFFGVEEIELGAVQDKSYASSPVGADSDWFDVPRLAIGASAGAGAFNSEEPAFDTFRFSQRWLAEQGLEGSQLSAISVEGDSMEPLLNHGDEILVDRSPRAFGEGLHVVRLGDSLMVKRVASAGTGRFALLSENPAYPLVDVAAEELEIIGRVVWKGGRL